MNTSASMDAAAAKQSDRLLWMAAAVVVGIGLTWLLISQPWSAGEVTVGDAAGAARQSESPDARPGAPGTTAAAADGAPAETQIGSTLDNPLRMAQLAYEAGMLVEPENYSAWALYSGVLEQDPGNEAARQGLNNVVDELLRRGGVALEQGRFDDARAAVERILAAQPDHAGAKNLGDRLDALTPKLAAPSVTIAAPPPERTVRVEQAAPPAPDVRPAAEPARERPSVDPVVAAHDAFERAMRENRLLTPADDSARFHVEAMLRAQADHELARRDQDLLVTELLARSTQALEALDTDAASTWIDEAEKLGADPASLAAARGALTDRLIAMESAKPVPASALKVIDYVAPEYPRNAASRGFEGWVDLEFTVARNGSTRNITVADASHDRLFRDEAIEAVQQWTFEPRIFMGQPIEQKSFTRLRFVLAE